MNFQEQHDNYENRIFNNTALNYRSNSNEENRERFSQGINLV